MERKQQDKPSVFTQADSFEPPDFTVASTYKARINKRKYFLIAVTIIDFETRVRYGKKSNRELGSIFNAFFNA